MSTMKKMLVTGGAGFIGANFVHYILKHRPEYAVTVVDALTYAGDEQRLAEVADKVTFVKADICDFDKMVELTKGVDVVAHFAAYSHVDRSIADPGPFLQTNILGTDSIARAAIKNGVERFHHVSTDEVFGTLELGSKDQFTEKTPYDPRSPYSAAKAASDHLVRAYGETYGLAYSITNCSNNYGPWDSPGRAVPVFISKVIQGEKIPLYGKGEAIRDYLFVEDHCSAIDAAIHQGKAGQTYCVGGNSPKNGVQLAEAILEAFGKPKDMIEFVTDRPGHDMRYDIDSSFIQKELGWTQSVSFEEGIALTVQWYKDHQAWWEAFSKRFTLMRDQGMYNLKGAK